MRLVALAAASVLELKSTNCLLFASRLQHQVKKHNLVVASYDVVRNDIDFFRCVFT